MDTPHVRTVLRPSEWMADHTLRHSRRRCHQGGARVINDAERPARGDEEPDDDDDDDDEAPETPLDEPAPMPIRDPPDEPNNSNSSNPARGAVRMSPAPYGRNVC